MNQLRILVALAFLPFWMGVDLLQKRNGAIEQGNIQLKAGKPEEALSNYDRALGVLPHDPGVHFNRGTALYALSRFDEAAQSFLRATLTKAPGLKAQAFYNLGNSHFRQNKWGEAIEAYKRTLALDPGDARAKWNLELALVKKRDEENKKKDDDKKKDDKNKDKDKKDQKDKVQKDKEKKGDKGEEKPEEKKDDPRPPEKKPDEGASKDEKKNEEKPGSAPKPQPAQKDEGTKGEDKAAHAADLKEIDAILDSLEQSPKSLEKERARARAVRRRPPEKDY